MNEVDMKVIEIKMMASIFNGLLEACSSKCISSYSEADLTVGESVCVERCATKWMETFKKVQTKMSGGAMPAGMDAAPAEAAPEKKGWFS
ncbi:hypothetical protein CYY_007326 [Polysphondylium violaceum]|uniref:Mitochondrial import inner membrane translocase subunit n=1 Tax=Polysphondylium violaceum TaxID=133409 RepID=A0A8J4PPV0_9MYCE|nr:hypothetical protein CYY_007326 [Polysphondylium violaceum]